MSRLNPQKKLQRVISSIMAVLLILMMSLTAPVARAADHVLVVSIDSLHPAALSKSMTPNLFGLMQAGRYTLEGRSIDPPKTLLAHSAMLTGLTPQQSGQRSNEWLPGEPVIGQATLFDDAKAKGYRTGFFYSKAKLGFLVTTAIDVHSLDPFGGIKQAAAALAHGGKAFVLLHISGLEYVGADAGWLSPDYLAELADIDRALVPLFEQLRGDKSFALIVTSDHGGHERLHGTKHPDDYKLPLIVLSDAGESASALAIPSGTWPITNLRALVGTLLK